MKKTMPDGSVIEGSPEEIRAYEEQMQNSGPRPPALYAGYERRRGDKTHHNGEGFHEYDPITGYCSCGSKIRID